VHLDQGKPAAGLAARAAAIRLAQASGERVQLIHALEDCTRRLATRDADASVRLAGAAAGERQALACVQWPVERRQLDGWLAQARGRLGPSVYQCAWDDGPEVDPGAGG
jgi:hypothetical protein